jgi:hypothetical protein
MTEITIEYAPSTVANILGHNLVTVYCYDNDASFWFEGNFLHCKWNGGEGRLRVLDDVFSTHIQQVLDLASDSSYSNILSQQV